MFNKINKNETAVTVGEPIPRPSHSPRAAGVPSIISADMRIEGNIISSGEIQIDGHIVGDIESRSVTIGQGAEVEGHVVCESARINGTMTGEVRAKAVIVSKSARITGDVIHESVAIEAGAHVEGSLRRIERDKGERLPLPPAEAAWSDDADAVVELKDEAPARQAKVR